MRDACLMAAIALGLALPALADDVKVKVIDPDKPAPTQPDKTSNPPTAPTTPPPPTRIYTPQPPPGGDWMLTGVFIVAKVTDEQKEKLKPVLDEMAAAAKADQDKAAALLAKVREANDAAKAAGLKDINDRAKDPAVVAAAEALTRQYRDNAKGFGDRRTKLLGSLEGVLSADQIRIVKSNLDRASPDLATRNKAVAGDWMRFAAPGVTFTDAQQAQIEAKAAPLQEKCSKELSELAKAQTERLQQLSKENPKDYQGNWKKASEEFGPKMDEKRLALAKEVNEIIESVMTDEKKKQMAAGREEAWKKSVDQWAKMTARSYEGLKLSDEQSAKVKELADAAGEAMLKTEMYDNAGRTELVNKLREDVKKLLTEEQLKMMH
jgi:hypothetical protein